MDGGICRQQPRGRSSKTCGIGPRLEVEEVSGAGAVAGPKFQNRHFGFRQSSDYLGPLVFPANRIRGEPDRLHQRSFLQIVDVPSILNRPAKVALAACPQTTRTEGASHIDIPAGLEGKNAEAADLDPPCSRKEKNQGIRTWSSRELRRVTPSIRVRHTLHSDTCLQGFINGRPFLNQ